jgi:5-methylcytosine-specific restriction enzyme subunit McrC
VTVRTETIIESQWATIALSADEQLALENAGRSLARRTDRFGNESPESDASLIRVSRIDQATARVRVVDAVGLVAGPTLQLIVQPKIPTAHLLYLFEAARIAPRLERHHGWMGGDDEHLAQLVCRWFVSCAEAVLEEGLARDYRPHSDQLSVVRGRLDVLATTRLYFQGRAAVRSEFEEYDFDTPLNRLLRHAARLVTATPSLPEELRRRALRIVKRMDGVGELQPADRGAQTDRRTSYYAHAMLLARQILAATGRTLDAGTHRSWTFLIRTAKPVEEGLRSIVRDALRGEATVHKGQMTLKGSTLTVNPDLTFQTDDHMRVGDIKYKLMGAEWNRADLYEMVAFAAAYRVQQCGLISFRADAQAPLTPLEVGEFTVSDFRWDARPSVRPSGAARQLADQLRSWLAGEPPLAQRRPSAA